MKDSTNGKFLFLDPADAPLAPSASAGEIVLGADEAIATLMRCLSDAGYDPVTQLTAYLIADDPTYLPEETEARAIARRIGRDKLLEALLIFYLEQHDHD